MIPDPHVHGSAVNAMELSEMYLRDASSYLQGTEDAAAEYCHTRAQVYATLAVARQLSELTEVARAGFGERRRDRTPCGPDCAAHGTEWVTAQDGKLQRLAENFAPKNTAEELAEELS